MTSSRAEWRRTATSSSPGCFRGGRWLPCAGASWANARDAAWLSPGAPLEDDPQPQYKAAHHRMYAALHGLPHRRELLELFGRLVRPPVLVHPRPALRVVFPGSHTTSAHQDFPFVQGTADTFTAWIPLMDCPRSQGVLELAPGSHAGGADDDALQV